MTEVVVCKGNDGRLEGMGDKGRRAYDKLRRTIKAMEIGETIRLSFKLPRSPRHHRYFFKKLHGLFDRQERFDDVDRLRLWLTTGAGYCELMPGPGGALVAVPESLSWDTMGEEEFVDLHQKVTAFMWSEHAMNFLWPQLEYEQAYQTVDGWHRSFERPQ